MIDLLLIKPAGPDCNMDCTYCFYKCKSELFYDSGHRMNDTVMETLIQKFLAQGAGTYSIVFQGGEPTLCGLSFFEKFISCVKANIQKNQSIQYFIQTNGILLDDDFCHFFKANNFLVGISLDGDVPINDYYRIDYAGKGTARRVLEGIALLKKHNVDFNTLSVLTKKNIGKAKEIYRFFKERGSGYMQFIPCLELDENKKVQNFCMKPKEYGDFLCDLFDLWYNNGNPDTYIRFFEETLISYVTFKGINCAQMPNCIAAPVIEYNGNIYPCDFFVEPHLKLGNVIHSEFQEIKDNPLFQKFRDSKWQEAAAACKKCRWKGLCFGDCCKNRILENGLSYYCTSYQQFYEYTHERFLNLKGTFLGHNQTYTALEKNIRRNERCLCGSGDKYKNCCLGVKSMN